MKLLVTLDFPPAVGGIQKYLYGIVRFMYTARDQVMVAGVTPPCRRYPEITASLRYYNSPLARINRKLSLFRLIVPYIQVVRKNPTDLSVECGNIYAAFLPWLLSGIIRKPYTVYTYGTELLGLFSPSPKSSILKRILYKAEKVYTLGEYSRGILRDLRVTSPVETVPPRLVKLPAKSEKKGRIADTCTILSVGRLVKHKGQANLIKAAAQLAEENRYRFRIVGSGPEYTRLQSLCGEMGVEECVTILHNLSDNELEDEFNRADIFVLASRELPEGTEGFGIVLLEAMARYIPVIASASGGIPEVLDNGRCGVLVEPDNVDALVKAIREVANGPSLVETLVAKAYERVVAHYVWR